MQQSGKGEVSETEAGRSDDEGAALFAPTPDGPSSTRRRGRCRGRCRRSVRFPSGSATILAAATLCAGVAAAPREFSDPLRSGGAGPVMVEITVVEPFEMGWFHADTDHHYSSDGAPRDTHPAS